MSEICGYHGNYYYAEHPRGIGGSHIPDWDRIKYLSSAGMKSWVQIVNETTIDTFFEDARRQRDEAHINNLRVRLYTTTLYDPAVQATRYANYLRYVISLFGSVDVLVINENKRDIPGSTIQQCLDHVAAFRVKAKELFGSAINISSPTINGLNPENVQDFLTVCQQPDKYDFVGVNWYCKGKEHIHGTDSDGLPLVWSLDWYLAKAPKPVIIWEYNCPEGTDLVLRNALLPSMHQAIRDSHPTKILGAHWFLESSSSPELLEQVYTPAQVQRYLSVLGGENVDVITPPPPPTPNDWDPQFLFDFAAQRCGGPGFNEDDAFGNFITKHPELSCGFYTAGVQGYDKPSWPFLWQPTTTGILIYDKNSGAVRFARSVSEIPTSPF